MPQPTSAPAQPGLPPFDGVIKGAKSDAGLIAVWSRDDKTWLEVPQALLDKPLFLSPKLSSGIGEAGLYGGLMASRWGDFGKPQLVTLHRVHNQIQLLAQNTAYVAKEDSAQAFAIKAAYSPSLLGAAPVLSQPHGERKSILIDAQALFMSDLLGTAMHLQRAYRQNYVFDPRNSLITQAHATSNGAVIEVQSHYATNVLAFAQPNPLLPIQPPAPTTPGAVPDARSLFVTVHYSLTRLPDAPMAGRKADPRVGYFTTRVSDFSDDLARTPKRHFVNRWRLEKKQPDAALSEPVQPITYWLDRSIPAAYREAIRSGVLEWNKAFERIGFQNAIVVRDQPADGSIDTLEVGHASIRWMTNSSPIFGAIAPTHVDPRSGEILDTDIALESLSSRAVRALRAQVLSTTGTALPVDAMLPAAAAPSQPLDTCSFADDAAQQLDYALDTLSGADGFDPDSPQTRQFVLDYLKETTLHEVGHSLGLRHNFSGSKLYSAAQLANPAFTREHGLTGSVMDYLAINLPPPGKVGGTPFTTTLGPYDYWAIEYAYKPIPADREAAELLTIAARSQQPEWRAALAYSTDEDAALGIEPDSVQFDLGADTLAYARGRVDIARDIVGKLATRQLKPTGDYSPLRHSLGFAMSDLARAGHALTLQIGGIHTRRDFPGSGRAPLEPVDAATQRAALQLLLKDFLAPNSLPVSPQLESRLAVDYLARSDALEEGHANVATDFSYPQALAELQRSILNPLMSEEVGNRLLDHASDAPTAFTLRELHQTLQTAIWSRQPMGDTGTRDQPALRRNLQREHVTRLAALLLRPSLTSRADGRVVVREQARSLLKHLRAESSRGALDAVTRAHLADCADLLERAINAPLQRGTL
ncbi:zinc-dependent metalloprotease [Aquabacterium sp.]|uniref:zinc-dependent metalloprotease n=1 Tax=Aquabacterium sp. TaxID=1872578 RepID=UPI0035B16C9C